MKLKAYCLKTKALAAVVVMKGANQPGERETQDALPKDLKPQDALPKDVKASIRLEFHAVPVAGLRPQMPSYSRAATLRQVSCEKMILGETT